MQTETQKRRRDMTELQKQIQKDKELLERWNKQDKEWEEHCKRTNGANWDGVSK